MKEQVNSNPIDAQLGGRPGGIGLAQAYSRFLVRQALGMVQPRLKVRLISL